VFLEANVEINVKCCVQVLKKYFFLSTVTADVTGFACSHIRAVLIYNEALASNCTLWGVPPDGSDLCISYDIESEG
jgi:hypothetical protein